MSLSTTSKSSHAKFLNGIRYFNKYVFNHFTLLLAGSRVGPFSKLIHTGRKSGKIYKTPVIIPKKVFDWTNKHLTRRGARNLSREFLKKEYDKAHEATLKALEEVKDSDFGKKVNYPDWDPLLSGEVTLERLFGYVMVHLLDIHKKLGLRRNKSLKQLILIAGFQLNHKT